MPSLSVSRAEDGIATAVARKAAGLHGCSEFLVALFWILGFMTQLVGSLFMIFKSAFALGTWLLFLGGASMSIGLTLVLRMRNRSWLWAFLGFLNIPGGLIVALLRVHCARCAPESGASILCLRCASAGGHGIARP